MLQRTLVLLKPDAVERKLCGEIIKRIENAELTILEMKTVKATKEQIRRHYNAENKEWVENLGRHTVNSYEKTGKDLIADYGTKDLFELGKIICGFLEDYMTSTNIVALHIQGNNAVAKVRKLAGFTIPTEAEPGTIRGDFSSDSPESANAQKRAIKNLIHSSGNLEEAEAEIKIWFGE